MHLQRSILLITAILLAVLLSAPAAANLPSAAQSAAPNPGAQVSPRVWSDTAGGEKTAVLVTMADQANLGPAYAYADSDLRGRYVYTTLVTHAETSQAGVRSLLAARGVAYRAFWISNALSFEADRALVDLLASRPDVARIDSDEPHRVLVALPPLPANKADSASAVEWGVQSVNAPAVWAMGYTGQGIVVGGADTGIRWTHEALKPHYRGWNGATADHNYNWFDGVRAPVVGSSPCGYSATVPCDDNSHGSHTIGTAAGGTSANEIGVAPGAKWIGCRNMDRGVGRPSTYINCFQFMTAPTDVNGNNPNPALRAHVISNSWGCPPDEECTDPNVLRPAVENSQAAGIFVVSSAGNSGPNCSTVRDPIAIYEATFTVGGYDIFNNMYGASSRGPVTVDGSGRLKPNIIGPAVNVRSATNGSDTGYANFTGTSMAAPHVAGAVALLWSARPELARQITETKMLLQQTANPSVGANQTCGDTSTAMIPNNTFGYGRVDALAALSAAQGTPTRTATAVPPATSTPTQVPPTATGTATSVPTAATGTPTQPAATATQTATPGGTASPTTTPCPMSFQDVGPSDFFFEPVRYLFCRGVISGYADGTFRPYNNVTRGQAAKMVVLAIGWTIDAGGPQRYTDVPPGDPFYPYVQTIANRGIRLGYDDNTFRPYNEITRGQLAKIIVVTVGLSAPEPPAPTFRDVPRDNPFYREVEVAYALGIISGYEDGTFRPFNHTTRGQAAKIVQLGATGP